MGLNSINIEGSSSTNFDLIVGFNSITVNLPISIGRIEFPEGVVLEESGIAQIIDDSTSDSYSVLVVDGYFYFYPYIDNNGVNKQFTLNVDLPAYKGSRTILAGAALNPPVYSIVMREAFTMATKRFAPTIGAIPQIFTNDFNIGECCYVENVFAKDGGEWWENDKSSFLLKKFIQSDTILFKLYKEDEFLVDLTDDTYGEFYNFEMYGGYVIYWQNIYNLFSRGSYKVKAVYTVLGQTNIFESRTFCLEYYDNLRADKTFRIETYQTGSIIRSGYNYDELGLSRGWYQSYRISGKFGNKKPTLESDYLLTSDRRLLQIQDKITYEYELQTGLLPSDIANILIEDNIIANEIFITDYNIFNSQVYRRIALIPSSVSDVKHYTNNRRIIYTITFKDKVDDILKRN